MRRLASLLVFLSLTPIALAADPHDAQAQVHFGQLSPQNRVIIQEFLAASGEWNAVPNLDFSRRLYDAISRFQVNQGYQPTGTLDAPQVERLANSVKPLFQMWALQTLHPLKLVTQSGRQWVWGSNTNGPKTVSV